ncbi:MAG: cytochrome c [Candidatus Thiodiazotropha sp.]
MIKTQLCIAAATLLVSLPAQSADTENGQSLYQENCLKCHGSEVYTRADRRINNLPALHKQVRFCEQNLGLTWFDDQIDDTTGFLNHSFYHFKPDTQ